MKSPTVSQPRQSTRKRKVISYAEDDSPQPVKELLPKPRVTTEHPGTVMPSSSTSPNALDGYPPLANVKDSEDPAQVKRRKVTVDLTGDDEATAPGTPTKKRKKSSSDDEEKRLKRYCSTSMCSLPVLMAF